MNFASRSCTDPPCPPEGSKLSLPSIPQYLHTPSPPTLTPHSLYSRLPPPFEQGKLPSLRVWLSGCGGPTVSGSEACVGGVDVPEAPFVYMCQASLGVRGHRMGVVLGYRHPLGSLRPFVGTVRPDRVPSLVCPCASWLCAGGSSPSDGRT